MSDDQPFDRDHDTPAETGPGIPDEAISAGEVGFAGLDDVAADRLVSELRRSHWAPDDPAERERDAQAESEAHPS